MLASRPFYYLGEQSFTTSGELESMFFTESNGNNHNNNNNDEEKEFDDSELMPYSSSSVGRSSVGSIPWADDSIKQNQLDWERLERMFSGEEDILVDETELAQEIREWQEKFPELLTSGIETYANTFKIQQSFDSSRTNNGESLDIDTLSSASMDFSGNEALCDVADGFATPTKHICKQIQANMTQEKEKSKQRQRIDSVADLTQLLGRNLRINSVPLTWRQRHGLAKNPTGQSTEHSEMSNVSTLAPPTPTPPPPPPRRLSPQFGSLVIAPLQPKAPPKERMAETRAYNRARMPPIFNVLETKRRFRGLANNRSFVQLTQLQETKSAAIIPHQNSTRAASHSQLNSNTWQVPLAAAAVSGRFLNQRNSIVLPAINLQRIHEHRSTDAPTSASSSMSLTPSRATSLHEYKEITKRGTLSGRQQPAFFLQQQYVLPARQQFVGGTSSTTPSTSGRSISAAVHHPRLELSAFYIPYSVATKFKSFNKM